MRRPLKVPGKPHIKEYDHDSGQAFATCRECGLSIPVKADINAIGQWIDGMLAQVAFPLLSADDRELLISGTCGECFDKMFSTEGD